MKLLVLFITLFAICNGEFQWRVEESAEHVGTYSQILKAANVSDVTRMC